MEIIFQEVDLDIITPKYGVGDSVSFTLENEINTGIISDRRQGKNKDIVFFYYVINFINKEKESCVTMIREDFVLNIVSILLIEIISEKDALANEHYSNHPKDIPLVWKYYKSN